MKKIRASKCVIRDVGTDEEKAFLRENHVQGYASSSVCIGLYYNDELVYLQSYGHNYNLPQYTWEMKRMCGLKDAHIYGGASKLLSYFCSNYDVGSGIVTFCDTERFDGHTYEMLGFLNLSHHRYKTYYYTKDGKAYHRSYGRKNRIYLRHPDWEKLYPDLTEYQLMEMEGFKKVEMLSPVKYYYSPKSYLIYRFTNKINGHTYVGQHGYYELNKGDPMKGMAGGRYWGGGVLLQRAYEKYGRDNFKFEVLELGIKGQESANRWEAYYIEKERREGHGEYNIEDGGGVGYITYETRRKISDAQKDIWDEEARAKRSMEKREYYEKHPEAKQRISLALKGRIPWNKGKKGRDHTDEEKKSISEKLRGIKRSEETKRKISEWNNAHKEERGKAISEGKKKSRYICVETGEIRYEIDWRRDGYTKVKEVSEGKRNICKGLHFKKVN